MTLGTGGLAATGSQMFAGITVISAMANWNTDELFFLAVCALIVLFCSWIGFWMLLPLQWLTKGPDQSRSLAEMYVLPQIHGSESHNSPVLLFFFFAFCRLWLKRTKQHLECGGSLKPDRIPSSGQQRMLLWPWDFGSCVHEVWIKRSK